MYENTDLNLEVQNQNLTNCHRKREIYALYFVCNYLKESELKT